MAADSAKIPPQATLEYQPTAFELLVLRYRTQLIVVAVLAVVGSLVWFGLKFWREYKHTEASVAFARATTVADLRNVAERYAGEAAAGSAILQSAELLADDGNHNEAVNELNRFLRDYPEHPLRDLAQVRLGDSYVGLNRLQEAEEAYSAVADSSRSAFAPIALVRLGDLRWQQNRIAEAKQFYTDSITRHSGHVLSSTAQERLKKVDVLPPVLVDPPAKPAGPENTGATGSAPAPVTPDDSPLNTPSLTDDPAAPAPSSLTDDPLPAVDPPALPEAEATGDSPAPESGGDRNE